MSDHGERGAADVTIARGRPAARPATGKWGNGMQGEVLRRRAGVMEAQVSEEELVLLGPDSEDYIGLDGPGTAVWSHLSEARRFEDLVAQLVEEFDASADRIAADIRPLIDELLSQGVLERVDAACA
ncbi:MAG: PqqD family protein [Pseudomonadota bacterium]